jgi:hypothetical protein
LRRAQADRKVARTEIEALGIIKRLENCLALLRKGAQSLRGESELTDHLVRIELGLARLDYSEYASSRDAKEAALREAARDVQAIVPAELPDQIEPEALRVIAGAPPTETDRELIGSNIHKLRGPIFWPVVQFYAETIENLMYGYKLIDRIGDASEMAGLNLALLREMANDRRKEGDNRDVTELLDAEEERDMYVRAFSFQREHAIVGQSSPRKP